MPYTYRRSPYARATRLPYTGGYRGRTRRVASRARPARRVYRRRATSTRRRAPVRRRRR